MTHGKPKPLRKWGPRDPSRWEPSDDDPIYAIFRGPDGTIFRTNVYRYADINAVIEPMNDPRNGVRILGTATPNDSMTFEQYARDFIRRGQGTRYSIEPRDLPLTDKYGTGSQNRRSGKGSRRRKQSMNIDAEDLEAIRSVPLATHDYEGIYATEDGRIVEMHEWDNPDWFGEDENEWSDEYAEQYPDSDPPVGSIYYDTYDRRGPLSGGILGYDDHDNLTAFEEFEGTRITDLILWPGQPGYEDLLEALHDGRYDDVKGRFGLPNRKSRPAGPRRR